MMKMKKRSVSPSSNANAPSARATPLSKRGALLTAMVGLFCAHGGARAGTPLPSPTALPSVEEVVAGNAKARGGIEAWRQVDTLTERGRIEHGHMNAPHSRHGTSGGSSHALDQSLPFTLQFKRPHKMRLEMSLGDAKALQLFDGTSGWMLQPSATGPLVHVYTESERAAAADQADPEGPLLDAAAKGTKVSLDGEDIVEGHRAYKLKLTLKNGAERHVWVDAQSMLDLKIDGMRGIEGKPWPTDTFFYDWKQAGKLKIPGRIETAVGDVRTSSRIVVEQVLVNAPLSDDLFSPPAGVPVVGTTTSH
jgi:hypothetical protein